MLDVFRHNFDAQVVISECHSLYLQPTNELYIPYRHMNINAFSSASTTNSSYAFPSRRQQADLPNNYCIFGQKLNKALEEERDSWTGNPLDFEFRLISWCRTNTSLVFRYQIMMGQKMPAFTCYNSDRIEARSSSSSKSRPGAVRNQSSRNISERSSSQKSLGRFSSQKHRLVGSLLNPQEQNEPTFLRKFSKKESYAMLKKKVQQNTVTSQELPLFERLKKEMQR